MPLHDFECPAGHVLEVYVGHGTDATLCYHCNPATVAKKVFLKAPAGFVQGDICYDSPIDGRPITNKHARLQDLARSGSIPYDPGMRQDMERNKAAEERQLNKAVDSTVDEFFATAPTRKLEKLDSELRAGADVEVSRASPATT